MVTKMLAAAVGLVHQSTSHWWHLHWYNIVWWHQDQTLSMQELLQDTIMYGSLDGAANVGDGRFGVAW